MHAAHSILRDCPRPISSPAIAPEVHAGRRHRRGDRRARSHRRVVQRRRHRHVRRARTEAERAASAWAAGDAFRCADGRAGLDQGSAVCRQASAPMPARRRWPSSCRIRTSAAVSALKSAGAVLTCKTTTCESGYKLTADSPLTGVTRNPWRLDRTSGGSSGGAAVAVAAGCGPLAIGTDAVGSIRVPSSFCGVFGLKPTFGLVPRSPSFFPPSWGSLAHTGPIGRTRRRRRAAARGRCSLRPARRRKSAGREAAIRHLAAFPRRPTDCRQRRFRFRSGHAVHSRCIHRGHACAGGSRCRDRRARAPPRYEASGRRAAAHRLHRTGRRRDVSQHAGDLAMSDAEFRSVVAKGQTVRGIEYVDALHKRAQLRGRFSEIFKSVDAIITPTVAVTAFAAGTIGVDSIEGQRGRPRTSAGRRSRGRSIWLACPQQRCPVASISMVCRSGFRSLHRGSTRAPSFALLLRSKRQSPGPGIGHHSHSETRTS